MKQYFLAAFFSLMATHCWAITIPGMANGGSVQAGDIAPVVRGGLNNFRVTLSTAASKAASDPTKGSVASVSGPTTVGHIATFSDINGTVQDGGAVPGGISITTPITAIGGSSGRTLPDRFADVYNAADYGVVCDGTQLTDVNIANGGTLLTSASVPFTAANVGATIDVEDTNLTVLLHTTIASLNTTVTPTGANLATPWTGGFDLTSRTGRATFYKTVNNITGVLNALSVNDALGHNTKGFKLKFRGVCVTGAITQPRLSMLACSDGPQSCTLYLVNRANASLVTSENFAALTGTGLNYGPTGTFNGRTSDTRVPTHMGLEDIHLDCNRLGQTAGNCADYYSAAMLIKGTVLMDEAYQDCFNSEMSDASAWSLTDWKSYEEGLVETLKTRNCGRYGWRDRGNKDMAIGTFIDAESKSTGFRSEISAGYYAGTIDSANLMHGYAEADHTALYFGAPANISLAYADYANMEINTTAFSVQHINTTACGFGGVTCIKVDNGTTNVSISGADIEFYPGVSNVIGLDIEGQIGMYANIIASGIGPGTNATGIKIGNSFNTFTGLQIHNMTSAGDTCIYLGGGLNVISGVMFSCYNFIDPTGDGGQNFVDLAMYKGGGVNYKTAYGFQASDYLRISHDDGTFVTQAH